MNRQLSRRNARYRYRLGNQGVLAVGRCVPSAPKVADYRDAGRVGFDVIGIFAKVLVDIAPEVGIAPNVCLALEVLLTIEVVESGNLFLSFCLVLWE
jgi:hypothetical protein